MQVEVILGKIKKKDILIEDTLKSSIEDIIGKMPSEVVVKDSNTITVSFLDGKSEWVRVSPSDLIDKTLKQLIATKIKRKIFTIGDIVEGGK